MQVFTFALAIALLGLGAALNMAVLVYIVCRTYRCIRQQQALAPQHRLATNHV